MSVQILASKNETIFVALYTVFTRSILKLLWYNIVLFCDLYLPSLSNLEILFMIKRELLYTNVHISVGSIFRFTLRPIGTGAILVKKLFVYQKVDYLS